MAGQEVRNGLSTGSLKHHHVENAGLRDGLATLQGSLSDSLAVGINGIANYATSFTMQPVVGARSAAYSLLQHAAARFPEYVPELQHNIDNAFSYLDSGVSGIAKGLRNVLGGTEATAENKSALTGTSQVAAKDNERTPSHS